ncbi:hypothetical protein JHL18_20335 [Clostridium sp. YIM B02505]|uniref:Peptidase C1A papain C-terminal domain-containing protein n=1 Tax=Clostridium yunnanense TaxID=2800325 RepID=A0ABS1EUA7_9CLOT|nr:C1 family peptidase [Clostridium yunnanense]MBK1812976.1 hypothetical protein [Clostridium yunnanense]
MLHHRLGWIPDYNDINDYTEDTPEVKAIIKNIYASSKKTEESPPRFIDLRNWCSPIKNQGLINSSTAEALVSLIEYFENKVFGKNTNGSSLFVYKNSRSILGNIGDTGVSFRSALKSLIQFGMPPERYYSTSSNKIDEDPKAFCYGFRDDYKDLIFFKLDVNKDTENILQKIKELLCLQLPCIFGFSVYDCIASAEESGEILFPNSRNRVIGGHSVMAVGYDDKYLSINKLTGHSSLGALIIKNSWGEDWGEDGYGYLPYEYILKGLAKDFWYVLKKDWFF